MIVGISRSTKWALAGGIASASFAVAAGMIPVGITIGSSQAAAPPVAEMLASISEEQRSGDSPSPATETKTPIPADAPSLDQLLATGDVEPKTTIDGIGPQTCSDSQLRQIRETATRVSSRLQDDIREVTSVAGQLITLKANVGRSANSVTTTRDNAVTLNQKLEEIAQKAKEDQHLYTLVQGLCSIPFDDDENIETLHAISGVQSGGIAFSKLHEKTTQLYIDIDEAISELEGKS